jgi:hypothetical protein
LELSAQAFTIFAKRIAVPSADTQDRVRMPMMIIMTTITCNSRFLTISAMKSLFLITAAMVAVMFTSCERREAQGDVTFAKSTFESLARGDTSVEEKIDWETFTSLGIPAGQQYGAFATEEDRSAFRRTFITRFSSSFRDSGGSTASFKDWRVLSHDDTHTKVAADSADGTLKLTVSERDGKERLSVIEIVK